MRRVTDTMKRFAMRGGHFLVLALMLVGLTGCYTQLATVDKEGTAYGESQHYETPEEQAYDAYEDRYYGRIGPSEYRMRLNTLGMAHFGDPFFYYGVFGDPLWHDPLYQSRSISRVRFSFMFNRYESCYYFSCGGFYQPGFGFIAGSSIFFDGFYGYPSHVGFGYHRPYRYGSFYSGYRYGFGAGFHTGYNYGSYYATPVTRRIRNFTPRGSTVGRSGTSTARRSTGRSVSGRDAVGRSSGRSVTGRSSQADRSANRGRVGRSADRGSQSRATTGRQGRTVERATPTRRSSDRSRRVERTTGRSGHSGRVGRSTDVRREVSERVQRERSTDQREVNRSSRQARTGSASVQERINRVIPQRIEGPSERERFEARMRYRYNATRNGRSTFRYRSRSADNRSYSPPAKTKTRSSSPPRTRTRSSSSSSKSKSVRSRSSNRSSSGSVRSRSRSSSNRGTSNRRSSSRSSNNRGEGGNR